MTAIVLIGIFPALAIYQNYYVEDFTQEEAVGIAENFLRDSPTFSFDGIEDSVEVIAVETQRTLNTWGVFMEFTSSHGGYGNRTGQVLTEALEDHQMWIIVSHRTVVEAVTDGKFNEISGDIMNQGENEAQEARSIALDFLKNAPTFSFDGIEGTMEIVDMMIAESYPVQYFITISFDCRQAGYGDRTDMMLAQVITTHEARITIVEGEIINVILDDQWDEMIQHEVSVTRVPSTDTVVATALDYIKGNYPAMSEVEVPEDWTVSNYNMEGLVGAMKMGYSGLGWEITMSWAVIMEPVYSVNISYGEFEWSITVDSDLSVDEITNQIPIEVMTPDIAKDMAVLYVIENIEDFEGLVEPEDWTENDLTPEGLLGFSTYQYISGNWEVNVSGPVVLEPTYFVEITYADVETREWSGAIEPSGSIVATPAE